MPKKPTFLMTDSSHFEVSYKINPWMTPQAWRANEAQNRAEARDAQGKLAAALKAAGGRVKIMDGVAGLPDMVFPANSAVVLNGRAMVARFRYHERQGEERHFLSKFIRLQDDGVLRDVARMPKGCWQEGAGDCIWDASRQMFWAGFGPRSTFDAVAAIKDYFGAPVVPLELVTGQYYHLDTCFAALSGGEVLYYPAAFSKMAIAAIKERVPADKLIEASAEDAERFSVNAVCIGRSIVMAEPSKRLAAELGERGYMVQPVHLRPFIMSGGGAYCMTLRLDLASTSPDIPKG
jgi:N-dimethylarginine dimethylaminohydrolase